jgi:type IV pilus assembly protein PilC
MASTTFDYKVRDRAGKLIRGQLEGENQALVARRLREMGFVPVDISRGSSLALNREIHIPGLTDRVKLKDVAMASRQLATMVSSGLTLVRSLSVLVEQIESKPLRAAVTEVRTEVERGSSLSVALARHPKIFGPLFVSMIQAGEVSGQLDEVLTKLATSTEKQVALRAKVRSAMTYPLIMVLVVIAVVVTMMIVVVPTFKRLYSQFHGKLPLPTRLVIEVSNLLASIWMLPVVGGIVLSIIGIRRWIATETGRRVWDTVKLRPPVFGPLSHKVALERFASTLASLLTAGVGIIEALDLAAENAGNRLVADAARFAQAGVREGRSLGSALRECSVIPTMFTQMVETGEESGAVGEMLDKVATFYGNEIESTVSSLTSVLEPLIIVFMGSVIGTIVVSLYLPMFKYITLVNNAK